MIRRDLLSGCWAPYLERAVTLKPCYDGGIDGGEVDCENSLYYYIIPSFTFKMLIVQFPLLVISLLLLVSKVAAKILQDTAMGKKRSKLNVSDTNKKMLSVTLDLYKQKFNGTHLDDVA